MNKQDKLEFAKELRDFARDEYIRTSCGDYIEYSNFSELLMCLLDAYITKLSEKKD